MSAVVSGLCPQNNGIAGSKRSMGSCFVDPKAPVKTGLRDDCIASLQALYAGERQMEWHLDAVRCHIQPRNAFPSASFAIEAVVMLDIVFIGIAVVFFAACLGYTLACERL